MLKLKDQPLKLVEFALRLGVFLTFFGHGYLAFKQNPMWIPYLQTVGFSPETSKQLIVWIGALDMFVAFIVLVKPLKYVVLWASIWAFSAALIRPISGEPIWSFVERGGNWLPPLALFVLLFVFQKSKMTYEKD